MPFAGFDDFDECVDTLTGAGVDDPEAVCARLHYDATGEWPGQATNSREDRHMTSAEKQFAPGSVDWARAEIARQLGDDAFVLEMFLDGRAIVERGGMDTGTELTLQEVSWAISGEEVTVGEPREVTVEYVAKSEGGPRLAGPIVRKDTSRHLAYAPVLVPGEPDSDGEVLSAEKVEEVAHTWLEQFRHVDQQHQVEAIDAAPVESYIEPADRAVKTDAGDLSIPAGTWTMAVKVRDQNVWDDIVAGKRSGFSIMGVPRDKLAESVKAVKEGDLSACKRVTLADVGGGDPNGDWVAPFVSIVSEPAVPKAKFYALKAAAGGAAATEGKDGLLARLGSWLGDDNARKESRRFNAVNRAKIAQLKEVVDDLHAQAQAEAREQNEESEMSTEEITEAVKTAVDEKLTDVTKRLDALEAAGKTQTDGSGDGAGKTDGSAKTDGSGERSDGESDLATKVGELAEKVDKLEERTRPGSSQPLDDVEPTMKNAPTRDAFGRRLTSA